MATASLKQPFQDLWYLTTGVGKRVSTQQQGCGSLSGTLPRDTMALVTSLVQGLEKEMRFIWLPTLHQKETECACLCSCVCV